MLSVRRVSNDSLRQHGYNHPESPSTTDARADPLHLRPRFSNDNDRPARSRWADWLLVAGSDQTDHAEHSCPPERGSSSMAKYPAQSGKRVDSSDRAIP